MTLFLETCTELVEIHGEVISFTILIMDLGEREGSKKTGVRQRNRVFAKNPVSYTRLFFFSCFLRFFNDLFL